MVNKDNICYYPAFDAYEKQRENDREKKRGRGEGDFYTKAKTISVNAGRSIFEVAVKLSVDQRRERKF